MKKGVNYTGVSIIFLCHDGEGNFLLSKRSKNCRDEHGRWDPGGGGLEFGDKVIETLKKEIEEEYCTQVIEHEFLGYRDVHRIHNEDNTHWVALDFKVLVDKDKVKIGEPHKFDDLKWFKIEDFPQPLHSQFPNFLELYKDKL